MRTKDVVRDYKRRNPNASLRQIQAALGISSPSVVKHHLDHDTKSDSIATLEDAMKRAIKIIDKNWFHQPEKLPDAAAILRAALKTR